MIIEPIAYFRSPLRSKFGVPRQSGLAKSLEGEIIMTRKYSDDEALRGLDGFDYIWLVWGFSANIGERKHPTVRPPRLGGNIRMGVFATRSPFRPNNLGLSAVKIEAISHGKITVSGADLMDNTPIFDIKPYLASSDSYPEAKGGFTDENPWKNLEVVIPDQIARKLVDAKGETDYSALEALRDILGQDPRPQYHSDPCRIYGLEFGNSDIRFQVKDDKLVVIDIKPL